MDAQVFGLQLNETADPYANKRNVDLSFCLREENGRMLAKLSIKITFGLIFLV